MIQKLNEGFCIRDESYVEEALLKGEELDRINAFFKKDGPGKLIFLHQTTLNGYEGEDKGGNANNGNANMSKELFSIHTGDGSGDDVAMRGKAVWFLKNHPGTHVDPHKGNDGVLSFGTVDRSIVHSLETSMTHLYKPIIAAHKSQEWGSAEPQQVNEFLSGLGVFIEHLQEGLKSLQGGIELRKPNLDLLSDVVGDDLYPGALQVFDAKSFVKMSTNETCVLHFVELLEEWCHETETYLEDAGDQSRWESQDSGPDTELDYWKRRSQKLSSITEQLKTKECKSVVGVLTAVTKQQSELGFDRQQVFALLRRWKQIDIAITEASNEAKDNVKYLVTLERFIQPLFEDEPLQIVETLPALVNSIKMIHTIARYYNTTERMTKLFMKITNQMINACKKTILDDDSPTRMDVLWTSNTSELLLKFESCLKLN